jgi:hypothetical protein
LYWRCLLFHSYHVSPDDHTCSRHSNITRTKALLQTNFPLAGNSHIEFVICRELQASVVVSWCQMEPYRSYKYFRNITVHTTYFGSFLFIWYVLFCVNYTDFNHFHCYQLDYWHKIVLSDNNYVLWHHTLERNAIFEYIYNGIVSDGFKTINLMAPWIYNTG